VYGVLLVDDEPIEREALRLLIKNNFQNLKVVGQAQNGFEAIELSNSLMPDIIIMDIRMPGISGLDAIREIKRSLPDVKFLILSSYNQFDYAQQALKLGVEDFIVKPVKMSMMKDALNSLADKIENEQKRKVRDSTVESRVEGIKPIIENDTVYSIVYGCGDENLKRFMDFLEIDCDRAFCMAVKCPGLGEHGLARIKKNLADIGCAFICADVNGIFVFYILNPREENQQHAEDIGSYVRNIIVSGGNKKLVIGLGKVYTDSSGFKSSYMEAIEAVRFGEDSGTEIVHYDSIKNDVNKPDVNNAEWIKKFSDAIWGGELKAVQNLTDSFILLLSSVYGNNISFIKEKAYQVLLITEKNFSH
jgi:two-component system response regulator YesN